jgi:hypothetical protein
MFGEWTETDRPPHLIIKYKPCGKRTQERTLKRLFNCQWDRNWSRSVKTSKLYEDDIGNNNIIPFVII